MEPDSSPPTTSTRSELPSRRETVVQKIVAATQLIVHGDINLGDRTAASELVKGVQRVNSVALVLIVLILALLVLALALVASGTVVFVLSILVSLALAVFGASGRGLGAARRSGALQLSDLPVIANVIALTVGLSVMLLNVIEAVRPAAANQTGVKSPSIALTRDESNRGQITSNQDAHPPDSTAKPLIPKKAQVKLSRDTDVAVRATVHSIRQRDGGPIPDPGKQASDADEEDREHEEKKAQESRKRADELYATVIREYCAEYKSALLYAGSRSLEIEISSEGAVLNVAIHGGRVSRSDVGAQNACLEKAIKSLTFTYPTDATIEIELTFSKIFTK